MTHWIESYLGQPWVAHEHDCWSFARRVWHERFAIDVPVVAFDARSALACRRALEQQPERQNWQSTGVPAEGDAVLMGKNARPSHVGVWIAADGGRVLHCLEGAGVVCNDLTSLKTAGWRVLGFYRRGPA